MHAQASCPRCGGRTFDLTSYQAMMVLRPDLALFTVTCPTCGATVSLLQPIPPSLREEVRFAAIEVGAGGMN